MLPPLCARTDLLLLKGADVGDQGVDLFDGDALLFEGMGGFGLLAAFALRRVYLTARPRYTSGQQKNINRHGLLAASALRMVYTLACLAPSRCAGCYNR